MSAPQLALLASPKGELRPLGASRRWPEMDAALARLADQVQTARAAKATLRIAGGGTKDFYGNPPQGEPLDMKPLAGISNYEPSELVVTVRGGTLLDELEAALAEQGQMPGLRAAALRGARHGRRHGGRRPGGPAHAPAAGAVRDHVLGATLLNGKGQVLTFGGQVMKNVAGYDVSRALAGSMGVLGAVCEVSLKVLPVAPATRRSASSATKPRRCGA